MLWRVFFSVISLSIVFIFSHKVFCLSQKSSGGIVSATHAIITCILYANTISKQWKIHGKFQYDMPNTNFPVEQAYAIPVSMGYFIYDSLFMIIQKTFLKDKTSKLEYFVHHILILTFITLCIACNRGFLIVASATFIGEMSNPSQHLWTYYRQFGFKNRKFVTATFCLFWLVFSVILCPLVSYDMISFLLFQSHKFNEFVTLFMILIILIINMGRFLFTKVVVIDFLNVFYFSHKSIEKEHKK